MTIFYNLKTETAKRKKLRNNATLAEQALWAVLKGKQLNGWKFRRQYGIGFYVVDFYCPAVRLAIEVDGEYHQTPQQKCQDQVGQDFITALGIRVMRFTNQEVLDALPQVLETIRDTPPWVTPAN